MTYAFFVFVFLVSPAEDRLDLAEYLPTVRAESAVDYAEKAMRFAASEPLATYRWYMQCVPALPGDFDEGED